MVKKVLFPIVVLVLALTMAIPVGDTVVAQTTDVIYGITHAGQICEVNPYSGTYTIVGNIDECINTHTSGPNGLAYDELTNRIYYCEYPDQQISSTVHPYNNQADLYFIDLDTDVETYAGLIPGEVADADIYNGKYYYIAGGERAGWTDDLYEVVFNADGTIGTITPHANISGTANHAYGFWGDIAIKDGVIYGNGDCKLSGHDYEFFRVNCDGTGFQLIAYTTWGIQISFGLDGTLYGHDFTAGDFYTLTWTDTSVTRTYRSNSSYHYTDLASGSTGSVEENPDYAITKVAAETEVDAAGDVIHYTIEVENTGNVTITGVSVSDPLLGTLTRQADDPGNNDNKLDVDETWVYTGTYTVLQSDIDNNGNPTPGSGLIENTATVSSNEVESKTADADVAVVRHTGFLCPTDTSVQMYAAGTWNLMYPYFGYNLNKDGTIHNISPGVMFYYNTIKAPSASFTLGVVQDNNAGWLPMLVQQANKKPQAYLYDESFKIVSVGSGSGSTSTPYTVTFNVTGATPGATYYIGIKYSHKNLVGINPIGVTSEYSFLTKIDGVTQAGSDDSITVQPN